tara:strand:- start:6 stop:689 length:684 start_codon:yes stop_codon:yes gene_type:complete
MSNKLVNKTIKLSLIVQIITTLISLEGIYLPLQPKDVILTDILKLEAVVQLIEGCFYIWMILGSHKVDQITPRRYIDWVITTPTMLISTIIYFKYKEKLENRESSIMNINSFISTNKSNIIKIVTYNAGMLLFGFLGETNVINKYISIPLGFIFFYKSFELIFYEYAIHSQESKLLFKFLVTLWALYGIAAMLPVVEKNICYNILDIFSKNFYGLYIYYVIKQINPQ